MSVVTLGETMALLNVPGRLGAGTTLLMVAAELGLQEVKFFPAAQLGGPAAIRALDAPFRRMAFTPSGRVSADNMTDYLALQVVRAVSGSWMVDPALLRAGRWAEVTARSADAVARAATRK